MNPRLSLLQPYPFEKLRQLFAGIAPPSGIRPVSLGIGEPQHATPQFIKDALTQNLAGLAKYPATGGEAYLREAIAGWLGRRYGLGAIDPAREVLPVNGSREALFALTQTVVDGSRPRATVVCPNPFYQIYEGAAILAGARAHFAPAVPARNFAADLSAVPDAVWRDTQLLIVCSPGNPTGAVMTLDDWREVFSLADRHGFVVGSDECYSEIYFDEAHPPLGCLQAAQALGRGNERLVMFSSLSKRSSVPGMRSGFVAGDAAIIRDFLLYRTYHGSAMGLAVQAASAAAWNDEAHVRENRRLYREKFDAVLPLVAPALEVRLPDAAFYLWARVPGGDDVAFTRELYRREGVTVLPGSYMARDDGGTNPGRGYIRMALVADVPECVEAAGRIARFCGAA
ncbi:MAG: succinyldiaminopimelate transaminase [Burkholderiales bacterium]|nr:succinyldiaminopimelate transaminase [Burkholderiales bacterium]